MPILANFAMLLRKRWEESFNQSTESADFDKLDG